VDQYDLVFEVETTSLLPSGLNDYQEVTHVLEVEAQDEGYLMGVVSGTDGSFVKPGTIMGVLCEESTQASQATQFLEETTNKNVYDDEELLELGFLWQAYTKAQPKDGTS